MNKHFATYKTGRCLIILRALPSDEGTALIVNLDNIPVMERYNLEQYAYSDAANSVVDLADYFQNIPWAKIDVNCTDTKKSILTHLMAANLISSVTSKDIMLDAQNPQNGANYTLFDLNQILKETGNKLSSAHGESATSESEQRAVPTAAETNDTLSAPAVTVDDDYSHDIITEGVAEGVAEDVAEDVADAEETVEAQVKRLLAEADSIAAQVTKLKQRELRLREMAVAVMAAPVEGE